MTSQPLPTPTIVTTTTTTTQLSSQCTTSTTSSTTTTVTLQPTTTADKIKRILSFLSFLLKDSFSILKFYGGVRRNHGGAGRICPKIMTKA